MISWNNRENNVVAEASFRAEAFTASVESLSIEKGKFKGCNLSMTGKSTMSAIEMGTQCIISGLSAYAWQIGSAIIACEQP